MWGTNNFNLLPYTNVAHDMFPIAPGHPQYPRVLVTLTSLGISTLPFLSMTMNLKSSSEFPVYTSHDQDWE